MAATTAEVRSNPGARTAAVLGRVGRGPGIRIRLCSATRSIELPIHDGEWGCFGLPAGRYRIELLEHRRILAREVELEAGCEHDVDFDL